jgi:hypothetical protein
LVLLPTIRTALGVECLIDALRLDCGHSQPLNKPELASNGYQDAALIGLSVACGTF